MFDSILIVCVGNICRSPTAERLLKQYAPDKVITSAGISAMVGHSADKRATEVASKHQLSLDGHIARQLKPELCHNSDLILVMERNHIDAVCQVSSQVRGKVMLFGHWLSKEIPDPYRKSEEYFQSVYLLLDQSAQKWAQALN
ncbi:protein tyrosine phosphatase [Erwiniaceae bacterium BAC15a-03b]|uniref:protein-tyrosine-phosphatase n=2 Tax=Winslowiella TaxID=2997349 RepID=A0A9J6PKI1_9GAMM|nr:MULTISPECIES: protein-tyrosine-phosphatase [Winslowiella]MBP2167491.1 protein-tyrosine phosphatase [Winslowiella toletana]MCU5774270.1 protein tyrosine phosphatase [Winslowiella arboricola]MCU5778817.1 protein tyrosine phosphatase [Winslowiella arboricola]